MSNPQIALKVVTISKSYQTKQVVDKLSFEVNQGEIVGLLGANGAGKTTAFYITMGLIKPDSGHVYFNNIDVTNEDRRESAPGNGLLSSRAFCLSEFKRQR